MIGDNARRCIIESSIPKGLFVRARVSFKNLPLKEGETPIENSDLTQTDGLYVVKFMPSKIFKWGAFLIRCDLFDGGKIRVKDYKDFLARANKDDANGRRFKFLLEWTNISPKIFEIAQGHLALPVPFGFQIEKYYKMILKQNHKRKGLVFRTEEEEEMQRENFFGDKEE